MSRELAKCFCAGYAIINLVDSCRSAFVGDKCMLVSGAEYS